MILALCVIGVVIVALTFVAVSRWMRRPLTDADNACAAVDQALAHPAPLQRRAA